MNCWFVRSQERRCEQRSKRKHVSGRTRGTAVAGDERQRCVVERRRSRDRVQHRDADRATDLLRRLHERGRDMFEPPSYLRPAAARDAIAQMTRDIEEVLRGVDAVIDLDQAARRQPVA